MTFWRLFQFVRALVWSERESVRMIDATTGRKSCDYERRIWWEYWRDRWIWSVELEERGTEWWIEKSRYWIAGIWWRDNSSWREARRCPRGLRSIVQCWKDASNKGFAYCLHYRFILGFSGIWNGLFSIPSNGRTFSLHDSRDFARSI